MENERGFCAENMNVDRCEVVLMVIEVVVTVRLLHDRVGMVTRSAGGSEEWRMCDTLSGRE
jgi:hypothetical protein